MNRIAFAKRLALSTGALLLALAAASPARADFAVVRFGDGYCRIWWDSAAPPWGVSWSKIALGLPNADVARAVLYNAIAQSICR
jgi:hypothetical protein